MTSRLPIKAQSAVEFLSTYAWAFLLMAIVLVGLYYFIVLPAQSIPPRCQFAYGLVCEGMSVGTNSTSTLVNLYLTNGQPYDLAGNVIATASVGNYGTASATCATTDIVQGGIILCSIPMPSKVPVGNNVAGRLYVNASVCLSGPVTGCTQSQSVSYVGNFTTQVSANANKIPVSLSISVSPSSFSHASAPQSVGLNAHVSIFGNPVRAAGVLFTISSMPAQISASISQGIALSDPNGTASTSLYVASASSSGSLTVNAVFAGITATNTVTLT